MLGQPSLLKDRLRDINKALCGGRVCNRIPSQGESSEIARKTALLSLDELALRLRVGLTETEAEVISEAMAILESGMEGQSQHAPLSAEAPKHRPFWSRSSETDPYNSFITHCQIRERVDGPLSGRSVSIKDSISVAGIPMTLGSRFMDGFVPSADATVVERILLAGGTVSGKSNMDPFCRTGSGFGGISEYGRCMNPYALDHLAGSSSSGSAVSVASRATDMAIGSDQGGSVRIPAAWCGVVGLKPTLGLIPFTGAFGMELTLDHLGPMARTVHDTALLLSCIAGSDGMDPRQPRNLEVLDYVADLSGGVHGLRIGVLNEGLGAGTEPAVEQNFREAVRALARAGAKVTEVSLPWHSEPVALLPTLAWIGCAMAISNLGASSLHDRFDEHLTSSLAHFLVERLDALPATVKLSILLTADLKERAVRYFGQAQNARRRYRALYDEVFQTVDCLVMPTLPIRAPKFVEPESLDAALRSTLVRRLFPQASRNTAASNISGHPAISVPSGVVDGLPIGFMVMGPYFSEPLLLRVAQQVESALGVDLPFQAPPAVMAGATFSGL